MYMLISKNTRQGFTLIELILYVGITAVILLTAGAIGMNILFGKSKLLAVEEVSQNARFAMEVIVERVRDSNGINTPVPGSGSPTISLSMSNPAQDPTVFTATSGLIWLQEGTSSSVALTSQDVIVTNVQFSNVSYPGATGTVRIEFTVESNNPGNRQEYQFQSTFYTTVHVP